MNRIAVITGASSGLGRLFAETLDKRADVDSFLLIARNIDELNRTKGALAHKATCLSADLEDPQACAKIAELINPKADSLSWLINASGFGSFGSFEHMDPQAIAGMIAVNCEGLACLTRELLPYAAPTAHIINVSSAASLLPQPNLAVYAATKSFVKSFSLALRAELKSQHITVSALCPRFMDTNFLNRCKNQEAVEKFMWAGFEDPKHCVEKAIKAAEKNKGVIFTSIPVALANVACKLLPEALLLKLELALQKR